MHSLGTISDVVVAALKSIVHTSTMNVDDSYPSLLHFSQILSYRQCTVYEQ